MRATEHDEAPALQRVANGGGTHPLRDHPFFGTWPSGARLER